MFNIQLYTLTIHATIHATASHKPYYDSNAAAIVPAILRCRVVCVAPLRLQTLVCEDEREGDFNRR
jgi:hypothetical protein